MNYTEIVDLAKSYSDRNDDIELTANMDNFIKIVESRVNRRLMVQKMAVRTLLTMVDGQQYYGLPSDFAGLRDIEIRNENLDTGQESTFRTTLHYLIPEHMNQANKYNAGFCYYTIVANQLQVSEPQDGKILELIYYRKLPNLSDANPTNWMSVDNPDVYVFGLLTEISSFIKNIDATQLWDSRFNNALEEISTFDDTSRWSGTPLQVRLS